MFEIRTTSVYRAWRARLNDVRAKVMIARRIERLQQGNVIVVLLCGGDKQSQARDIRKARDMARELG